MITVQAFILVLYILRTNLAQQPCDNGSISEVNLRKDACHLRPISVTAISGHLRIDDLNCNIPVDYTEFTDKPLVVFPDAQEDSMYTLAVVDPDAPTVTKGNYFIHWLVADIEGSDFLSGNMLAANTLMSYLGPQPPNIPSEHHHVYYVFEQNTEEDIDVADFGERSNFDLEAWIETEQMCGPIAGIQFHTSF